MSGAFDLDAAEAIASGGVVESWEALDSLGRLVDKSMVLTVTGTDGAVRYRLLETLRQFAAERLAEQPDVEEARDRHAQYWMERAVGLARRTRAAEQAAALATVDRDIDNYRTALAHLLTSGRGDDAARMVLAMGTYWLIRRVWEGLRWYQQVLNREEVSARRRTNLLALAAHAAAPLGELDLAEGYATDAIALASDLGVDPPFDAYHGLMMASMERGDVSAQDRWWHEGRPVARASGIRYFELLHEASRPLAPGSDGFAEAAAHYEQLLPVVHDYGASLPIALTEAGLARVLYWRGDEAGARERMRTSLTWAERAGQSALGGLMMMSISSALDAGDTGTAIGPLARAVRIGRDEGNTFYVTNCAFFAAVVAARRGNIADAAALVAGGSRYADPRGMRHQAELSRLRDEAEAAIAGFDGDLSAARARGAAMTIEDLVNEVLRVVGDE